MPAPSPAEFCRVAAEQSLVSEQTARELLDEAASRGVTAEDIALERSLLSPVQVDIVHMLMQPEDAIPGYHILSVLGHGGMGVVFRARQKNLDRVVALKTVLVSRLADANSLARFEQEARTIGKLAHPNIVAAYDFGKRGSRFYLAMELVEGEDLEQYIDRQGRLSEPLAWGLCRQAAAGLAHAARLGVVHRDVKPANMLLVPPPEGFPLPPGVPMVKLTDFGLALLTHDTHMRTRLTIAGTTLGSPQYMSPEQFSGSDVDRRADIYALGATVFQMLAGSPPFHGGSLAQIVAEKVSGAVPSLSKFVPGVSQASQDLVADMMARDPKSRIADYDQLIARIDKLPLGSAMEGPVRITVRSESVSMQPTASTGLDGTRTLESVASAPAPVVETQAPPAPDAWRRWRPAMLTLLALIAVVVVGWMIWGRGQSVPDGPTLVSGDWSANLFDGESMTGWLPLPGGFWNQTTDVEGAPVISGRGRVRRPLPAPPSRPLSNYSLSIHADLRDAKAVELHFALVADAGPDPPRYVLRAAADGVWLLRRDGDAGQDELNSGPFPLGLSPASKDEPAYHDLRVERHVSVWRAYFDGKLIGVVPAGAELPEFRLAAEGGAALFGSPQIIELVANAAASAPSSW